MPRILFVALHRPDRSPSQRFRFEQYIAFLNQHGFETTYSYVISEWDDKIFYSPGNFVTKAYIVLKGAIKRISDVIKAGSYDLVFIQREAFMVGSSVFEKMLSGRKVKLVYDFDDAIWKNDVSDANRNLAWLKNPAKIGRIISLSDLVIAGNDYLAEYASRLNDNVVMIPTTVDTDEYMPQLKKGSGDRICIGWSGSITTIRYFVQIMPALKELKQKFGDKIYFKVIGDGSYRNEELGIQGVPWSRETEIHELSEIDIGIMPMPDDEWTRGKCGLKALVYMSLEIPTVISPVGVNTEIVKNRENGLLASTTEEWVDRISELVSDPGLMERLGKEGRKTVVEKYSVESQKSKYLDELNRLIS